jgi:hypothetical protein
MIPVEYGDEEPPQEWLDRAAALTAQLEAAATPEERADIIDANQACWQDLKDWLLRLHHQKCWFSEAKDLFSYWHVEHFRPKKKALDLQGNEREGYWWLAFQWRNFRICGGVGNSKKGTYFPVRDGTAPASSRHRRIEDEQHVFLDPVRPGDPPLVTFNEEGMLVPQPGLDAWSDFRVRITAQKFKLNEHEALVEARRDLWQKVRQEVDEIRAIMTDLAQTDSPVLEDRRNKKMRDLRERTKSDQHLSRVVSECLRTSGYPWAVSLAS